MNLSQISHKFPDVECELFLAHILKQPIEFVFIHPEHELTPKELVDFVRLAKKRRNGMPAAYLLGYKDFFGLRFKVNQNVLIPRPETERLVEAAIEKVSKNHKIKKILDMGTGSGCIAISLATALEPKRGRAVKISAADVSRPALSIARTNARTHKAKIKFIQSNLFKKTPGKFDLVIANLPYVLPSDYRLLLKNLKYEPKSALTDDSKTWKTYEAFFRTAKKHLSPNATILLEIDPKSKDHLAKWSAKYLHGSTITFSKDLRGLWRYAEIQTAVK